MQRSLTPAVLTALIALYLIWGSTYFAMRLVVEGMPPLLSAGIRYTIAGALMVVFLKWRGAAWPTAVACWFHSLIPSRSAVRSLGC